MLAEIFGPDLLIVVLVVVVVLFGGAAIPKLARNLGSAKKEFEKGIKEGGGGEATDATPTVGRAPDVPQNPVVQAPVAQNPAPQNPTPPNPPTGTNSP
jgi:sec-independent protein translocase protein TatA